METYERIKAYLKEHGMTKAKQVVKAFPDVTEVTVRGCLCKGLKLKEFWQPQSMHYAIVEATPTPTETEQPKE